jgi:small ligand-binding sensory domain FIST
VRNADHNVVRCLLTAAQSCFVDGWQDAFLEQAQQLVPYVANGTVVGIFFGDEVRTANAFVTMQRLRNPAAADQLLLQRAFCCF